MVAVTAIDAAVSGSAEDTLYDLLLDCFNFRTKLFTLYEFMFEE